METRELHCMNVYPLLQSTSAGSRVFGTQDVFRIKNITCIIQPVRFPHSYEPLEYGCKWSYCIMSTCRLIQYTAVAQLRPTGYLLFKISDHRDVGVKGFHEREAWSCHARVLHELSLEVLGNTHIGKIRAVKKKFADLSSATQQHNFSLARTLLDREKANAAR